ncbi:hypothetical protein GH714_010122 [Hevea brasiliensis]|uniref:Uncharacterized protein n=1 Tax=Hevea brasiliensis TaxID=3981 RepID=A0A6A6LPB4_HEVBR|nr:hypothetical protein GH714_010122 [Hevea brasiliensis]
MGAIISRGYTTGMYKQVQNEIKQIWCYNVYQLVPTDGVNEGDEEFIEPGFEHNQSLERSLMNDWYVKEHVYTILYNEKGFVFKCNYRKFELKAILCTHILKDGQSNDANDSVNGDAPYDSDGDLQTQTMIIQNPIVASSQGSPRGNHFRSAFERRPNQGAHSCGQGRGCGRGRGKASNNTLTQESQYQKIPIHIIHKLSKPLAEYVILYIQDSEDDNEEDIEKNSEEDSEEDSKDDSEEDSEEDSEDDSKDENLAMNLNVIPPKPNDPRFIYGLDKNDFKYKVIS